MDSIRHNMPGPGEYDTFNKDRLLMKGYGKGGMGKDKRLKDLAYGEHSSKPAPGSYDISNK